MPVLQPNSIFANRYRLDAHLGTGGFSEVWRAIDQMANEAVVVLKVYLPGRGMDETGIKLFSQEYSLVVDINHPHLLTAMHFDIYEGSPYLILPYCPGGNLFSRIQDKGPYDEKELAQISSQVAGALAYLHERDIVHQDIKPDNVLIKTPDHLMLSDFGISFKLRRSMTRTMAALTQKYGTYYTPYYSPPEKNTAKPGPASDIFSLGVALYEMATGELPFEFTGKALKEGAKIPPLGGDFSTELDQVLQACMSLEPDFRPTAQQLKDWSDTYLATGHWIGGVDQPAMTDLLPEDDATPIIDIEELVEAIDLPTTQEETPPMKEESPVEEKAPAIEAEVPDPVPEEPRPSPVTQILETVEAADEGVEEEVEEEVEEVETSPRLPDPLPADKSVSGKLGGTASWAAQIQEVGEQEQQADVAREKKRRNFTPLWAGLFVLLLAAGGGSFAYFDPMGLFKPAAPDTPYQSYKGPINLSGLPEGEGKAIYANGDTYEGTWAKGEKMGQGTLTYANGNTYVGQYKAGVKSGMGTFTYADRSVYVGEFKNGKRSGKGVYTYVDGSRYEGNFVDDEIQGLGAYYEADSSLVVQGQWKSGTFVGPDPQN